MRVAGASSAARPLPASTRRRLLRPGSVAALVLVFVLAAGLAAPAMAQADGSGDAVTGDGVAFPRAFCVMRQHFEQVTADVQRAADRGLWKSADLSAGSGNFIRLRITLRADDGEDVSQRALVDRIAARDGLSLH